MNNLKQYRQEKKISQIELADLVGVTNDYISMLERDVRTPSLKLARTISKAIDKTVEEVFPTE